MIVQVDDRGLLVMAESDREIMVVEHYRYHHRNAATTELATFIRIADLMYCARKRLDCPLCNPTRK